MAEQSAEIADELRGPEGGQLDWARFYADPRAKRMYFSVMSRMIRAFRSFDARRDWAMKVMQHDPTAVGLSSTVYIERPFEGRSEEHTSELQSLMRISYAVFCLNKKNR